MTRIIPFLAAIWTLMILYFTLSPSDFLPETSIFGYDKIGHFGLFGGWTGLLGLILLFHKRRFDFPLWKVWMYGILFSFVIEIAQWGLPLGRSAEGADMVANVLGCSAAIGIIMLLRRLVPKKYLALDR